jgi:hypothetical protein
MSDFFSWQSPSSRLVLTAVLDTLAERGWEGLTVPELHARAGSAAVALGDAPDLESLVIAALPHVDLFPDRQPTGDLRRDLRLLLAPWREAPDRNERIVAALLSAALRRPRLRDAVHEALDGPLNRHIAGVVAHANLWHQLPPGVLQTLCWVLRGLFIDRLRSGPRSAVDLELLVEFLLAGLQAEPPDRDSESFPAAPPANGALPDGPGRREDDPVVR